ncbi:hypothetical protein BDF14DRAFT_1809567 [Spinellus fusiger]|nr:hypothetical protein BDF14DRAFT_1809567 [Spinellus fusiger]
MFEATSILSVVHQTIQIVYFHYEKIKVIEHYARTHSYLNLLKMFSFFLFSIHQFTNYKSKNDVLG